MIKFIHSLQIILMIAVLAISFFINYDFFITHLSFTRELFLASSGLIFMLAAIKFLLKLQMFSFIQKNQEKIEISDSIQPNGKKRILTYELLVWLFFLALALFQTKLFGLFDLLTLTYFLVLVLDILFWILFQSKFQVAIISGQIFIFTSRPQIVGLKNIKSVEKRYNDYYINYTTGKFKLLKSDLISEQMKEKINASF